MGGRTACRCLSHQPHSTSTQVQPGERRSYQNRGLSRVDAQGIAEQDSHFHLGTPIQGDPSSHTSSKPVWVCSHSNFDELALKLHCLNKYYCTHPEEKAVRSLSIRRKLM